MYKPKKELLTKLMPECNTGILIHMSALYIQKPFRIGVKVAPSLRRLCLLTYFFPHRYQHTNISTLTFKVTSDKTYNEHIG